ncbi:MAG: HIT domain-containing protein [Gammaproteobacteria bacterium]|nr:MAG: HIT domain-containing protein [Gammaproteobacteria bacterium]
MNIHPQLEKDCLVIGRFPLCYLLLMLDSNYPWFILVPDRDDVSEIYQLNEEDQVELMKESSALAACLTEHFEADKLNIAALGNVVPQLHIHHIVRYRDDVAWPAPVWGKVPAKPYSEDDLKTVISKLRQGQLNRLKFNELDS